MFEKIQGRLFNGMREYYGEGFANCKYNGDLYNNLNQAVLDVVEESRGDYLLTLTEYNRIIALLESYEYPKSMFRALYYILDNPNTRNKIVMDYEMFATWLKILREEIRKLGAVFYLDFIKRHAGKFDLEFYDLIDYLIPPDGIKLSDELKRLRDYPEDFEFSDDVGCYIIKNIGGFNELLIHFWELECL